MSLQVGVVLPYSGHFAFIHLDQCLPVAVVFRIHKDNQSTGGIWQIAELLSDFVEGNYTTLAGWWHVLRGISVDVIADAGMVA